MPYVYHDAKSDAVIPARYEKIGTAVAKTNATAAEAKQRKTYADQPSQVCVWMWYVCRKRRTKTSFAAACA